MSKRCVKLILRSCLDQIATDEQFLGGLPVAAARDQFRCAWRDLLASLCDSIRSEGAVTLGSDPLDRTYQFVRGLHRTVVCRVAGRRLGVDPDGRCDGRAAAAPVCGGGPALSPGSGPSRRPWLRSCFASPFDSSSRPRGVEWPGCKLSRRRRPRGQSMQSASSSPRWACDVPSNPIGAQRRGISGRDRCWAVRRSSAVTASSRSLTRLSTQTPGSAGSGASSNIPPSSASASGLRSTVPNCHPTGTDYCRTCSKWGSETSSARRRRWNSGSTSAA